jgi:dienelactone hydrolase
MRSLVRFLLLGVFLASCGHMKKEKSRKDEYSPVVSFTEEGKKYEGTVQYPKDFKEKLPLVVIVHEWWGRTDYIKGRAKMLNDQGYATLTVDLFGDGKTVETPAEAQALATPFYQNPELGIARLSKFVDLAKKDPHVDPLRVFVIGYCFGGTQALNLARSGADIKGVVSFHGGLASSVQAKELKARVLAINGLADPMVPAKERADFEKEMRAVKADYKVVNYRGATHAFTNPKATKIGKKYNIPIAYHKKADEGSWKDLLSFLKE